MVLLQSEGTLPVCTHCLSVFSVRVVETPGDGGQPHGVPVLPHHAFFSLCPNCAVTLRCQSLAAVATCNVTWCFQNTLDMLQVLSTVTDLHSSTGRQAWFPAHSGTPYMQVQEQPVPRQHLTLEKQRQPWEPNSYSQGMLATWGQQLIRAGDQEL